MPFSFIALRALFPALILVVTACQQQAPPLSAPADKTAERPVEVIQPKQPEAPPEPTRKPEPENREPDEPRPVTLNLEIPADLLDEEADTGFPQTENRYLPDLFAKKKKAGTSVSGELLLDEEQDFSIDAVTGAKITVEIPVE